MRQAYKRLRNAKHRKFLLGAYCATSIFRQVAAFEKIQRERTALSMNERSTRLCVRMYTCGSRKLLRNYYYGTLRPAGQPFGGSRLGE